MMMTKHWMRRGTKLHFLGRAIAVLSLAPFRLNSELHSARRLGARSISKKALTASTKAGTLHLPTEVNMSHLFYSKSSPRLGWPPSLHPIFQLTLQLRREIFQLPKELMRKKEKLVGDSIPEGWEFNATNGAWPKLLSKLRPTARRSSKPRPYLARAAEGNLPIMAFV